MAKYITRTFKEEGAMLTVENNTMKFNGVTPAVAESMYLKIDPMVDKKQVKAVPFYEEVIYRMTVEDFKAHAEKVEKEKK